MIPKSVLDRGADSAYLTKKNGGPPGRPNPNLLVVEIDCRDLVTNNGAYSIYCTHNGVDQDVERIWPIQGVFYAPIQTRGSDEYWARYRDSMVRVATEQGCRTLAIRRGTPPARIVGINGQNEWKQAFFGAYCTGNEVRA